MQTKPLPALAALALASTPACAPPAGPPPTALPLASAAPAAAPTPGPAATPSPLPTEPEPFDVGRIFASVGPGVAGVHASAPAPGGRTAILAGHVYDADGAKVSGATVTVRSLDASVPYEATTDTPGGSWVINNVPYGALVEIRVTKPGWTARMRTGAFEDPAGGRLNRVDFGGDDPDAAPHFLSDRPEIAATAPAEDGAPANAQALRYLMKLSEQLSAEDARRFTRAVRLRPAADPGAWAIGDGSTFFGQEASVTWNAARDEALLTVDGMLGADASARLRYEVALVPGDFPIEDPGGRALTLPFRRPGLTGVPAGADAEARWAATHQEVGRFEVGEDGVAPRLLAADVSRPGGDLRLTLAFDEPLAAFSGGTGGRRAPSLAFVATGDPTQVAATGDALGWLAFALGDAEADVAAARLRDPDAFDPRPAGARLAADDRAYRFVAAALAGSPRRADLDAGPDDGRITAMLDPADARRLHVDVFRRPDLFAAGRLLRVRVQGLADPAGNRIGDREADLDARTIRL